MGPRKDNSFAVLILQQQVCLFLEISLFSLLGSILIVCDIENCEYFEDPEHFKNVIKIM